MMTDQQIQEIDAAFDSVTAIVRDRLSRNERIRRNLPGDGRVRIDRQLPFLCVYRAPPKGADPGTRDLATTEGSYLLAAGKTAHEPGLLRLTREIAIKLREHFGAFLLVEIWAEDDRPAETPPRDATRPGFRIVAPRCDSIATAATALEEALHEVRSQGWPADVLRTVDDAPGPPGRKSLAGLLGVDGCFVLGLAVRPVYRDANTSAAFPVVLRSLRRQLAVALRKCVFAFSGQQPAEPLTHYEALGPSALVKGARLVDQQLSEVSQAFDFVLQTVPLNSAAAWEDFKAFGFTKTPVFYYRPLPYDPAALKRRLFEIPIDRVEDVTLIQLFAQKQDHLDRQLTALKNIDMPAFFYDGMQLYGMPDNALVQLALQVLATTAKADRAEEPAGEVLNAEEIVAAARDQIDFYHQRLPGFVATVHVRNDLASTMMVAQDRLYVAAASTLPRRSVDPLLHHEIGTHLLTYFNGRQQPLQQLFAGLAGYEELQEGLAVLAEYLAGGLTPLRLRTLACRVLAVRAMVDRRPFVEAFQLLHDEHSMPAKAAFMTVLRAFRGGGLTKDAIYLRGLRDLVDYLHQGHDLEPLYVGKIALEHVPAIQELRRRGVVGPPAVLPSFLSNGDATLRLDRCRQNSLLELVEHP